MLGATALPKSQLGRTGFEVSVLALGSAALGIEYGLPGSHDIDPPAFDAAVNVARHALRAGLNFFDTAPAYGHAEAILGEALAGLPDVVVASKVAVKSYPKNAAAADVRGEFRRSVEGSLKRLKRDHLDILQLHSVTRHQIQDQRVLSGLEDLRADGLVRATGATVYEEDAALAAIGAKAFDIVQIAFNILDQRAARRVIPTAAREGVAIWIRSALLKGALTSRWRRLPAELSALREVVRALTDKLAVDDRDLATLAMRFCLSRQPEIAAIVIGPATVTELDEALLAAAAGPLSGKALSLMEECAIQDDALLNPSSWPLL